MTSAVPAPPTIRRRRSLAALDRLRRAGASICVAPWPRARPAASGRQGLLRLRPVRRLPARGPDARWNDDFAETGRWRTEPWRTPSARPKTMASNDASAGASSAAPAPAAPEDPTELRLQLHRHGYRPVPVLGAHVAMKAAGKRPMMKGWETVCASADETEIARWTKAQRNCTNTGLLVRDAHRHRHRRARPPARPPADLHCDRDARHDARLADRARAEDPARLPH